MTDKTQNKKKIKHNPQDWRVMSSGILIFVFIITTIFFAYTNIEIAKPLSSFSLGFLVNHGITLTDWEGAY